ncbi:hypothetical protein D3C78_1018120 [compost metagenome]
MIHVDGLNILRLIDILNRIIGHPDFFTLINVRSAFHQMQQNGEHLGALYPILLIIAPTGYDSRQIMVVPEQTIPAFIPQFSLPFGQYLL